MAATMDPGHPTTCASRSADAEQRMLIHGVSWNDYAMLNDVLGAPGVRMWYSRGTLELMTTSTLHERLKKSIARMIELFAFATDLPLNGYGSATFRNEAKQRGAEPDECYCVGAPLDEVPDIVLEVVLTSGGIDKLDVYVGLGIREVWFYEDGSFHLHELHDGRYRAISASLLVPGLNFDVLASLASLEDQHDALKRFRDTL